MIKCSAVIKIMEEAAPRNLALEYDNVGLIIGDEEKDVRKILIALDLDESTVDEAVENSVDLVITHHPIIFKAIKNITESSSQGRRIIKLIKNNISAYASHTNLDMADGGTNDALFELLGLRDRERLDETGHISIGLAGNLECGMTLAKFLQVVKDRLNLDLISYAGELNAVIKRVGLCTGSASEAGYIMASAAKGCDVYLTGDVTYHNAQAAKELGIAIVDGTHFGTEILIVHRIAEFLARKLENSGINMSEIEIIESRTARNILRII